MEIFKNCPQQVPTKVIGSMIVKKLKQKGLYYSTNWRCHKNAIGSCYPYLIWKSLRAKEYAQNLVYGYMLERENPGTMIRIQIDEENRFEYFFMALGPYITWFTLCRPEVAIDGTHLKGKYKGVLYVAAAMDGNEQNFPITFGVGNLENDHGWKWFLNELRNVIGCLRDLILIFNHHISIKNAVEEVFPNAAHGLCDFHMKRNLKKYINETVTDIF